MLSERDNQLHHVPFDEGRFALVVGVVKSQNLNSETLFSPIDKTLVCSRLVPTLYLPVIMVSIVL